jgi:hypothetical protein
MKLSFKNPFAIKESDTVGDAVIKGMTEGYVKGTIASGIGLGVVVLLIKGISKKGKNSEQKKVIELTDEEVEQAMTNSHPQVD